MADTDIPPEPAVTPPIIAPASANVQAALNLLRQVLAIMAILIVVLGLGETSMVVKLYRIASNDQVLSGLSAVIGAGLVAWSAWKARRRTVQVQTLAALPMVPDSVARLSGPISPAVQAAVDVAMQGHPNPPISGYDYAPFGETLS